MVFRAAMLCTVRKFVFCLAGGLFAMGKWLFLDKDMGTPPLTSHPVHGGRSLDEVLRDKGAGRGLREAAPGPSEPGTQSICAQASLSQGRGPSCGTLRNSGRGTEPLTMSSSRLELWVG